MWPYYIKRAIYFNFISVCRKIFKRKPESAKHRFKNTGKCKLTPRVANELNELRFLKKSEKQDCNEIVIIFI